MAFETLFLVRHSKAVDSHPQGDRHRELSGEGRRRIRDMLPRARDLGFRAEVALSSPWIRAVQTRDFFLPLVEPRIEAVSATFLPESDPEDAWDELLVWEAEGHRSVAVFTHNPLVTALAEALSTPPTGPSWVFHTPTIAAFRFPRGLKAGEAQVLWILNP